MKISYTLSLLVLGLTLLVFTGAAPAVGDGYPGGPGSLPTRDGGVGRFGGLGDWFKRACTDPTPGGPACNAQVVTNADGTPLATSSPPATAYGPAQFAGAYGLPVTEASTAPTAQTVAIVDAYSDPNIATDLQAFDSAFGVPAMTTGSPCARDCFEQVNQTGGSSLPPANSGWDLEIALDVETVHSICQSCNIILVAADSASIADLGAAEDEAAALGANVITNSWGAGEFAGETGYDSHFNHPGVAITASAGDSGYGVEWPAATPEVTAVGGTTLTVTGGGSSGFGYGGETAWSGSGSGCSSQEARPSWQASIATGCGGRAVNDVAADADPNTGEAVYDSVAYDGQSGWFQVGGTSLSAQLIGAVYALTGKASSVSGGSTPYSAPPGALHDVTGGNDGSCSPPVLCAAGLGWDGPTGLGTPDGLGAFEPAPATPSFSLSASAATLTVNAGAGSSTTITVNPAGGFSGSVTLAVSGLPSGATPTFTPTSTTSGSTLAIATSSTTAAGTYTLTVKGTSGSLSATTQVTLVVQAPSFTLATSPPSRTVSSRGSTTYAVSITAVDGFSGPVSLSASGLPSGVTASFSSNPATTSSTLTLRASGARSGTSRITITGTSGGLTATTTVTLSVSGSRFFASR
jgi:hypothetical protein